MSELVDCINNLSAEDIVRAIAKTANGVPFYLQTKGGAWTPASIANIEFWFDGQDSSTLSLNGNKIIQWNDKSGNARHVAQAVDGNRPTWSSVTNRVTFVKASSQNLRNAGAWTISQPHTTVLVYKKLVSKDIAEYAIGSNTGTPHGGLAGSSTSGAGAWVANSGAGWNAITNDLLDHIHIIVFNSTSSKYYLDGAAAVTGNTGTNVMTGIELGSYNNGAVYTNIELMEAIGYSGIMSDADRALLIAYLQDKWSL